MNKFIIYSTQESARFHYITKWIFNEFFLCDCTWTNDIITFQKSSSFKINYSEASLNCDLQIIPHHLLFELSIEQQKISMSKWHDLPVFFINDSNEVPFDIFAASFYLISRYEEYICNESDEHGRFPHSCSLAFKENFLQLPLVDLWLLELKKIILQKNNLFIFPNKTFQFIPTYDIDIAYSFKGKKRSIQFLSSIKDLLKFDFSNLYQRILVLSGKAIDPYDAYHYLDNLHQKYSLNPIYFFLIGKRNSFNKNIAYSHPLMQNLINNISSKYQIGIHPSYNSSTEEKILKEEIDTFHSTKSRQHYIRFTLPHTYHQLALLGIKEEYSMGYGSINGFRAGTSHSFLWFDISNNQVSEMRIFPFCFMECNSFYEQKFTKEQAYQELLHYYQITKDTDGLFITIWHNFSLGTDKLWKGWKEIYEDILNRIVN